MKNRVSDVRNHLVAAMERLNDPEPDDDVGAEVQKAKALSDLAREYTATVKVELRAREMAGMNEELPEALERPRLIGSSE